MPNRKVSHLRAKLEGGSVGETFDIVDEEVRYQIYGVRPIGMKKVIALSDSYGVQSDGALMTGIRDELGLSQSDYYYKATGSMGFARAVDNKVFINNLQDIVSNMAQDEIADVTHVIVVAGANDTIPSQSAVETAIATFCSWATSNLPNARIYIGFIGYKFNYAEVYKYGDTIQVYKRCIHNAKTYYLNGVEFVMHNSNYMISDSLHPNADGCRALAAAIRQALVQGSVSVGYQDYKAAVLHDSDSGYDRYIRMRMSNDVMELSMNNSVKLELSSPVSVECSGSTSKYWEIANLSAPYGIGNGYEDSCIEYTIWARLTTTGNNWTEVTGRLQYANRRLHWHPLFMSTSTQSYSTMTFNQVILPAFKITMATCWN